MQRSRRFFGLCIWCCKAVFVGGIIFSLIYFRLSNITINVFGWFSLWFCTRCRIFFVGVVRDSFLQIFVNLLQFMPNLAEYADVTIPRKISLYCNFLLSLPIFYKCALDLLQLYCKLVFINYLLVNLSLVLKQYVVISITVILDFNLYGLIMSDSFLDQLFLSFCQISENYIWNASQSLLLLFVKPWLLLVVEKLFQDL